jgi:phosphatidylglycerol:prolipoprotein diacylglycerol transferase
MLGRWGNLFNMEAFGVNTKLPWGMTSLPIQQALMAMKEQGVDVDPEVPVHPCFLYESLWCFAGVIVLAIRNRYGCFSGELTLIYAMWYGFGRFFIEFFRSDHLMFLGANVSQVVSGVLFACAGLVLAWVWKRDMLKG